MNIDWGPRRSSIHGQKQIPAAQPLPRHQASILIARRFQDLGLFEHFPIISQTGLYAALLNSNHSQRRYIQGGATITLPRGLQLGSKMGSRFNYDPAAPSLTLSLFLTY